MFECPTTVELSDHRDALVARTIALYESSIDVIGRNFYIDNRIVDIMHGNDLKVLRNTLCYRYELAGSAVGLHGEGSYDPAEHWNWLVIRFRPLSGLLDQQFRTILKCMKETVSWEIANWDRDMLAQQRRKEPEQEMADDCFEYDGEYDEFEDEDKDSG